MAVSKDQLALQSLVETQRPARMVGLFTAHALKTQDLERLVNACTNSMRQGDAGASLALAPLGLPSPQELAGQHTRRLTVVVGGEPSPHTGLGQVFQVAHPESPPPVIPDHIRKR